MTPSRNEVTEAPAPARLDPFEPLYCGPAGRQVLGLYHAARGVPGQPAGGHLALLICSPFGREETCAYRSLRHLAEATAQAGFATLRFDYVGCGNSEGRDATPEQLADWVASVHTAAETLKQRSGASRVVLLGLRLGALLASQAAVSRTDVADFIAVAPVVSGRAFVRELKALQMAGGQTAAALLEAGGFALAPATVEGLSAIDLNKAEALPAHRALLIDRDDLPGTDKLAAHWRTLGMDVEQQALPGYTGMMADPHNTQVPAAIVAAVVGRLRQTASDATPAVSASVEAAVASTTSTRSPSTTLEASLDLPADAPNPPGASVPVRETAGFIGTARTLFGIVSAPLDSPDPARPRRGIVMLNAGANRLIGPSRLYVDLARYWAAQGFVVLRLDIAGLGDSPAHAGAADNVVYSPQALQDLSGAIEHLRQHWGVGSVQAVGLCSGAYHSFKGVVQKLPLRGAVIINPLTFFWKEGMSLDPNQVADYKVAQDMMRHRQSLWKPQAWAKLLRGQISPARLVQIARQATRWVAGKAWRAVARALGLHLTDDLASELRTAAKLGVPLHFVFADTDPGLALLRAQGGASVEQLRQRGQLSIDVVNHSDHTFTQLGPRQDLIQVLRRLIAAS